MAVTRTRLIFCAQVATALSLLCGSLTLASSPQSQLVMPAATKSDHFDPKLSSIDTLDTAVAHIRANLSPSADQAEIAEAINRFLEYRFTHGLGTLSFSDDWVAWLGSKVIWENLAFSTLPDDMLKSNQLICSQQAMLFHALLERFDIEYATIGFGGPLHMLVGAKINGTWAVYDSDQEPRRNRIIAYAELTNPAVLREMYRGKPGLPGYGRGLDLGEQYAALSRRKGIEMKWVNENPAPRATFFHQVTRFGSKLGWSLLSVVAIWFWSLALSAKGDPARHIPSSRGVRPALRPRRSLLAFIGPKHAPLG